MNTISNSSTKHSHSDGKILETDRLDTFATGGLPVATNRRQNKPASILPVPQTYRNPMSGLWRNKNRKTATVTKFPRSILHKPTLRIILHLYTISPCIILVRHLDRQKQFAPIITMHLKKKKYNTNPNHNTN